MSEFKISDHAPGFVQQRDGDKAWAIGPDADGMGTWVVSADDELRIVSDDGMWCEDVRDFDVVAPWIDGPEPPDPGEGWRLLCNEAVSAGDVLGNHHLGGSGWCDFAAVTEGSWKCGEMTNSRGQLSDGHFVRRRIAPQIQAGDWVRSGGKLRQIAGTGDAGVYYSDGRWDRREDITPVTFQPLDADGLRALVGRSIEDEEEVVCVHRYSKGMRRVFVSGQWLNGKGLLEGCWTHTDGLPVGKAVPR